ncbi:MAG TPA: DUF1993 domain-containing protein [Burkholderiaceae bacterium]|nr:DUF1993 domain-containing protein [Burkholderiaceae bacterium]
MNAYDLTVPVFARLLGNLETLLDKAAAHAEAKKFDPAVLVQARLAPDMFPLVKQVQIAADFAKGGVARLTGAEPPKWEDTESSIAELKARIARTREFVEAHTPERFVGALERQVEIKLGGQPVALSGLDYLNRVVLPNFYFHLVTAYDILRHNGVDIGKRDYLGPLP